MNESDEHSEVSVPCPNRSQRSGETEGGREGRRGRGLMETSGGEWHIRTSSDLSRVHLGTTVRHQRAEAAVLFAEDCRGKISVMDTLGPRHSQHCRSHADHPLRVEGVYCQAIFLSPGHTQSPEYITQAD